jgi:hypothetical protein
MLQVDNIHATKKRPEDVISASKEDGLEISEDKAKSACVDASPSGFKKNCDMTMGIIIFDNVEELKH